MSYVNISELADQVLRSVQAERSTKIAAAPTRTYVPVAQELRKLAEDLRAAPVEDEAVGDEDIAALLQDPEVQELLAAIQQNPELLQQVMQQGAPAEAAPPEGMPVAGPEGLPPGMPEAVPPGPGIEQKAAQEIRKIATYLKANNTRFKDLRAVKAAHTLNAATGLKHLTEGFK